MNRRCLSIYPGSETLLGKPIRCEGARGHEGQHGHSFAARYWEVGAHSCALCGVESLTDETSPCRFERGCSCWRGVPCRKPTPIAV